MTIKRIVVKEVFDHDHHEGAILPVTASARTLFIARLFNRRFTRLTLGYSKTVENLKHAIALFIAHFNFCRVHSSLDKTPAMAAGLSVEPWSIEELLRQAD